MKLLLTRSIKFDLSFLYQAPVIVSYKNCEDAEWVNEDHIDPKSMVELIYQERNKENRGFPVVSLKDRLKEIWTKNVKTCFSKIYFLLIFLVFFFHQ